jgi:hypothetical protein
MHAASAGSTTSKARARTHTHTHTHTHTQAHTRTHAQSRATAGGRTCCSSERWKRVPSCGLNTMRFTMQYTRDSRPSRRRASSSCARAAHVAAGLCLRVAWRWRAARRGGRVAHARAHTHTHTHTHTHMRARAGNASNRGAHRVVDIPQQHVLDHDKVVRRRLGALLPHRLLRGGIHARRCRCRCCCSSLCCGWRRRRCCRCCCCWVQGVQLLQQANELGQRVLPVGRHDPGAHVVRRRVQADGQLRLAAGAQRAHLGQQAHGGHDDLGCVVHAAGARLWVRRGAAQRVRWWRLAATCMRMPGAHGTTHTHTHTRERTHRQRVGLWPHKTGPATMRALRCLCCDVAASATRCRRNQNRARLNLLHSKGRACPCIAAQRAPGAHARHRPHCTTPSAQQASHASTLCLCVTSHALLRDSPSPCGCVRMSSAGHTAGLCRGSPMLLCVCVYMGCRVHR